MPHRLLANFDNSQNFQFNGTQYLEKPEIQIYRFNKTKFTESENLEIEELSKLASDEIFWINIYGIHDVEFIKAICSKLNIHRMIVGDILEIGQRPKIVEFDSHLFFSIKSILPLQTHENGMTINREQISFVLGKNYIVSFQEKKGNYFQHIRERIKSGKGLIRERGADFLTYFLLEAVLDNYFDTVEALETKVNKLLDLDEDTNPHPKTIRYIEDYKKTILQIRKALVPLKDAIGGLEKGFSELIEPKHIKYFFDLKDQCLQLNENLEYINQKLESGSNFIFSLQSHKMNQIIKLLTIVSTIFIPLTFVAGIYGMNFKNIPELKFEYGYIYFWIFMLTSTFFMLYFFKKKKWL